MASYTTDPEDFNAAGGDAYEAAAVLACEVATAEVELLAAEMAAPGKLVIVAEGAGITPASFGQQDLRLVHCAADVARHLPIDAVLRLARRALQAEHYWNPKGPISFNGEWSDESLELLANRYPISETAVWQNARHLLALRRRWDMAESLLQQFRTLLAERDDLGVRPAGDVQRQPAPPRQQVVSRFRKGLRLVG